MELKWGIPNVRILITGVSGFAGRHLAQHLLTTNPNAELHGIIISATDRVRPANITYHQVDLRSEQAVRDCLETVRPDQIYHLAGRALVRHSFDTPWETLENNIHAQLNLIRGCLAIDPPPRMVIIASGEIYGPIKDGDPPPNEEAPMRPATPYSVSKVTQDMLGLQYFISHKLPILRARPFNHFGPGQGEGFVAPDFAMQIARIEAGLQEPVMKVGDLSAERDFTDVRDIVRGYALIMERGTPGEAYNLCSGRTHSIQHLLDTMLNATTKDITVRSETKLMGPTLKTRTWGDASKLRAETGWQPEIPFEQTVLDVLNDCRQRVAAMLKERQ